MPTSAQSFRFLSLPEPSCGIACFFDHVQVFLWRLWWTRKVAQVSREETRGSSDDLRIVKAMFCLKQGGLLHEKQSTWT